MLLVMRRLLHSMVHSMVHSRVHSMFHIVPAELTDELQGDTQYRPQCVHDITARWSDPVQGDTISDHSNRPARADKQGVVHTCVFAAAN